MQSINERIQREICKETINALTDTNLMDEYTKSESVKNEIMKLSSILDKYVNSETAKKIIDEYSGYLIPPGTKGVIRGNKFNQIVKNYIVGLKLNPDVFDVQFEKTCSEHLTSERPDWYIRQKTTNMIIIGMNQLALWGGGQQENRGSKYLINNEHNTTTSKLVCVVCNETVFKTQKTKAYKLFETGFRENTLCYLGNLRKIIYEYFEIAPEESG